MQSHSFKAISTTRLLMFPIRLPHCIWPAFRECASVQTHCDPRLKVTIHQMRKRVSRTFWINGRTTVSHMTKLGTYPSAAEVMSPHYCTLRSRFNLTRICPTNQQPILPPEKNRDDIADLRGVTVIARRPFSSPRRNRVALTAAKWHGKGTVAVEEGPRSVDSRLGNTGRAFQWC